MNKLSKLILSFVIIVLAINLTACMAAGGPPPTPPDGEIYSVFTGSVIYGVKQALSGAAGSAILQDPNNPNRLMFIWTWGKGVGFIGIDGVTYANAANIIRTGGNYIGFKDAGDFVKFLEGIGYTRVGAEAVPEALRIAAMTQSGWMELLGHSPLMFMFLPAGVDYDKGIEEQLFPRTNT